MKIKSIELKNFRNFKDASIGFSHDIDNSFTVILGENTYGKTTLIKAFLWCFYGENTFKDKILLNKDVADCLACGNEETTSAEVYFTYNDKEYKITRRIVYYKLNDGSLGTRKTTDNGLTLIEVPGGLPIPGETAQNEIDNIIRPELKEYFFFDGENNTIENATKNKNIKQAVSNILGIDRYEEFAKILSGSKGVVSHLQDQLKDDDNLNFEELTDSAEKTRKEIERLENSITEQNDNIVDLNEQIQSKTKFLEENKSTKDKQEEIRKLESDLKSKKEFKNNEMKNVLNLINNNNASSLIHLFFANNYKNNNFKKIGDETSFNSEDSYKDISENAIDDLIKKGRCICGTIIKDGNDAYKHLIESKIHMKPRDFSSYIELFLSSEDNNLIGFNSDINLIRNKCVNIKNAIFEIENIENKISKNKKDIEGLPDIGSYQTEISNLHQKIGYSDATKKNDEKNLEAEKIKLERIDNKIKECSTKSDHNKFILKCIDYANGIAEIYNKKINGDRKYIKRELELNVETVFNSIYGGQRRISIDDEYKVDAKAISNSNNINLDTSTGLQTIINYSFVAGLLKTCEEYYSNNSEDNIKNYYPLVMDAPFSSLDEGHIRKICSVLPTICEQLIMFVMNKDFNFAEGSINERIGRKYKIIKISETESKIKEVF